MSELQEDVDMMNDPLLERALDENNYDLLVPNLEELNTLFSGMQSKYESLQADAEHSGNVVILLRRIMNDVKTLTKDKVLVKKYIEMLNKKYEELKAIEEATKISGQAAQQQKEELSRCLMSNNEAAKKKEKELLVRINNVSVGSDVRKAFNDLLNAFQELSLSNKKTAENVIESNTESMNVLTDFSKASIDKALDSSKASINDVAESLKASINSVAESSKTSINNFAGSSKISFSEVVESSKASIIGVADSSKKSVNGLADSSKNSMNALTDSSKSSIIKMVESSTASIELLFNSSKKSLDETAEQAKKSIDDSKTSIQKEIENINESIRCANSVIDEGVKSVTKTMTDKSTTLVSSVDQVKISLEEKTKASIEEFVTSAKATIGDNVKSSNDDFILSVKEAIGNAIKTGRASAGKERKIVDQADEIERLLDLVKSQETMISTLSSENHSLKRVNDTLINEKNSIQAQLDAEKNNFTRVTGERNLLEADKTTLQAEKTLLDTRVLTLQNDNNSLSEQVSTLTAEKSKVEQGVSTLKTRVSELKNNAYTSSRQITALEKSVSDRDQTIKTLESTIIPHDDLKQQLLEKTDMIQQLQSIDYEKMSEGQEAMNEAYQKENNNHLDKIRDSHQKQLVNLEQYFARHMEKNRNYHNETFDKLLKISKVPVAPCPSCAQHEEKIASFKRDVLAKDSEIKTLRDQVNTIKDAVTSQTELIKLQGTLYEDIKSFKKKKEVREKALASMTEDRDQWREMHQKLSSQQTQELGKLRLELGKPTLELENKVRELNLATEKLKKDNEKVFEDLTNCHKLAIESKEKEIELLKSENESIRKMKPATPVSPTAPEASPISEGSAVKKRNHEIFSGSPQSKFVRAWRKYCSDMFTIADKMVPEGVPNVSVGFCRISQCFVSEECIKTFNELYARAEKSHVCK
ncbi:hypothetical protein BTUL_0018g00090 [Botrytis tulipae]|uniref:Uncharacterized protein n=1 Tax=Botrytis tulipae TaxID=87230 RepID=A0A4Z1F2T2_9HELO|nr:hypothetical protein BTUL_0018g00090 [Botrytis tulipae]